MTPERQEAKRRAEVMLAFADGANIEWRIADGGVVWREDDSPSWEWKSFDYRANPNPVVNWDAMPAWANWVSQDSSRRWHWYTSLPIATESLWFSRAFCGQIPPEHAPKYAGTKPWYELIIERPKK